jgi:hypothetical protein
MKLKVLIAGVFLFASFSGIYAQDKCPNVVIVPKTLYDSFQNAKGNAESLEREFTRVRQVRDDLSQKYRDCEYQADIAAILKKADDDVKNVEANLKTATEAYRLVDQELRRMLHDADGFPVVYRFYDSGYGNFGRVWTMTFSPQDGKIVIVPTYYQLPDHAVSAN